jgi:hypothetical protein
VKVNPGDKITIKIGDQEIETTVDEYGVQRLPRNPIYDGMIDKGLVDLNEMVRSYRAGRIKFEDYLEFYLNIGYSVSGFADLSSFQHLEIRNPIWEK